MFLEKCGKFFFLQMRPPFFFILVIFPLIMAALFLSKGSRELQDLEARFAGAARKERLAMDRKARKELFLKRYSMANPYFLDQHIESFPLLQKERQKLESLLYHPAFPESQPIKNRLAQLAENRLAFKEERIEASSQMKEVEEKQRHPVQMDESDIKQILSLIEDVPVENYLPAAGCPQILIKELLLKKHETQFHTEVSEVEMDLIKREFTGT
jgi:hypothetical protein